MIDKILTAPEILHMSKYGKNLKWMIKNSPLKTQKRVSEVTGVSESVISRLISKDSSDLEAVDIICTAIKAPVSRVFDKSEVTELSENENKLLQQFSRLSQDQQIAVIELLMKIK